MVCICARGSILLETWEAFCYQVKHHRRYSLLSDDSHPTSPAEFTPSISPVERLRDLSSTISEVGLLCQVPSGQLIWRGRMRSDREKVEYTAATLGSTPHSRAASNRMSPAGISMFYGSDDPQTAVKEISAHDTRPYAAVAAFALTRSATVIDLIDLPPRISNFDGGRIESSWPINFIRSFAKDLSRPVTLDGREHLEYVPTQVLTEYFRHFSPLRVDGIRFHSAQNRGINYVLFVGPEGCTDSVTDGPTALLRFRPDTQHILDRS